jgi:hypothetical protein
MVFRSLGDLKAMSERYHVCDDVGWNIDSRILMSEGCISVRHLVAK